MKFKLKFYFARQKFYRLFWTKKQIEIEAQRKRAREMASPEIKQKVKDYYYKFRYLQEIIGRTKVNDNSKIIDIGCGIKTVLHFLPGKLKVGIDPLADDYKKIYNYPSDLVVCRSYGENIVYPDVFFDIVFITNALDHTKDPKQVINESFRLLKKKGYLVIVNELVKSEIKRDRAHPHNLLEDDILNLIKNRFEIIFKKYSPWFGLRQYYLGLLKEGDFKNSNQIIILAQKI